jgi:FtsP/CotA-like multicopper oxidase with cupredoxin domain
VTSRQRIILLAIAAVVLVGGVIIAASSGGDDEPSSTDTTAAQTSPSGDGTTTTGKKAPKPRVESIRIKAGKPVGGAKTLKFTKGDTVALSFSSDEAGEVHIHGYDKEVELTGSGAQTVRFKADLEGIYEIEDHESDELLAKLEVRPK